MDVESIKLLKTYELTEPISVNFTFQNYDTNEIFKLNEIIFYKVNLEFYTVWSGFDYKFSINYFGETNLYHLNNLTTEHLRCLSIDIKPYDYLRGKIFKCGKVGIYAKNCSIILDIHRKKTFNRSNVTYSKYVFEEKSRREDQYNRIKNYQREYSKKIIRIS